jgi:hypothetical protein
MWVNVAITLETRLNRGDWCRDNVVDAHVLTGGNGVGIT